MRRREFIATLSGAAAWPLTARAQQTGKRLTVALLSTDPDNPLIQPAFPAFLAEVRKLGFTEGGNLIVESRRIEKESSKSLAVLAELIDSKVDVLVATGPEIVLKVAAEATRTIPIG